MSSIIKSNGAQSEEHAVRCAAFNLDDLAEKGNRYLAEVRRQAAEILAGAKNEVEQLRRQAAEQGRADALKSAQQQAEAKTQKDLQQRLQTLLPALTAAVGEIQQAKAAWQAHWEKNAVKLAAAIASRVVRREIQQTPDIPLVLVRDALELASGSARIAIHLSVQDHQALGDRARELVAQLQKAAQAEIVADPDLSPGGCRVVTEFGEIDQRIESQLARIEEELTG